MLFVYYLLARNEEWRMRRQQPGEYEAYMARTSMFLPGEPGAILYRVLFGWIRPRGVGLTVAYLALLGLSIGAGFWLRDYTLRHLTRTQVGSMQVVSVYPRPVREMIV